MYTSNLLLVKQFPELEIKDLEVNEICMLQNWGQILKLIKKKNMTYNMSFEKIKNNEEIITLTVPK